MARIYVGQSIIRDKAREIKSMRTAGKAVVHIHGALGLQGVLSYRQFCRLVRCLEGAAPPPAPAATPGKFVQPDEEFIKGLLRKC